MRSCASPWVLLLSSFLLVPACSRSTEATKPEDGFRGSPWGASRAEVKAKEKSRLFDDSEELVTYDDVIAGRSCKVLYGFTQRMLTNGMYLFELTHASDSAYIKDFNEIEELISLKYSKPTSSGVTPYRADDPTGDLDRRPLSDDLAYWVATWELPATRIQLLLKNEDGTITLRANYWSRKHMELMKSERKRSDVAPF